MQEHSSIVTSKGQVTIPAAIRRHLGLSARDTITFVITEGPEP